MGRRHPKGSQPQLQGPGPVLRELSKKRAGQGKGYKEASQKVILSQIRILSRITF
jgi:hypothetical protein